MKNFFEEILQFWFMILRSVFSLIAMRASIANDLLEETVVLSQSGREYKVFRRSFFNGFPGTSHSPAAVYEVEFTFKRNMSQTATLVTLPFFAAFPGLMEKLWMEGPEPGVFAGMYFFKSRIDAQRYSASMAQKFISAMAVPGTYHKSIWNLSNHPMKQRKN
ncbi:MAG: YdhR family protein [Proteobacteria bacterium]|nr:YdhR family protein [Pseudomonadota bacterium]